MNPPHIHFNKISSSAVDPLYCNGGYKLYSDERAAVYPKCMRTVRTGICTKLNSGLYFLRICSQESNLAANLASDSSIGLRVSEETVPAGYPHELRVIVYNFGQTTIRINVGDCIAQLVMLPLFHPTMHVHQFVAITPSVPTEDYLKWREWYLNVTNSNSDVDDAVFEVNVLQM